MVLQGSYEAAAEKIRGGAKEISSGGREGAVKGAVTEALVDFCRQSPEFADAVVESGKCMAECVTEILRGVKSSISDMELYRRAVAFWVEGAEVHCEMRVILPGKIPDVREDGWKAPKKVQILSLEELLR